MLLRPSRLHLTTTTLNAHMPHLASDYLDVVALVGQGGSEPAHHDTVRPSQLLAGLPALVPTLQRRTSAFISLQTPFLS